MNAAAPLTGGLATNAAERTRHAHGAGRKVLAQAQRASILTASVSDCGFSGLFPGFSG